MIWQVINMNALLIHNLPMRCISSNKNDSSVNKASWFSLITFLSSCLTQCGLVAIWWNRSRLILILVMACYQRAPNQCWLTINVTPENKFQWNSNLNTTNMLFQENASEMAVCNMVAILFKSRCVKAVHQHFIVGSFGHRFHWHLR